MKMKPLDYKVFQVRMNMDQVMQPIVINQQDTTMNIHNCSVIDMEEDMISDTEVDNFDEEYEVSDQHNSVFNTLIG